MLVRRRGMPFQHRRGGAPRRGDPGLVEREIGETQQRRTRLARAEEKQPDKQPA